MRLFRYSVWYYVRRNTFDSCCLTLAFVFGVASLIVLIVYYVFPSCRIPVSWDERRIDEVNNLIITLCGGYLVTYLSYFFTVTIPTAVKTQYKRHALFERARYLKDYIYEFLNGLCEFCYKQDCITIDNIQLFLDRNCDESSRYTLKADSRGRIRVYYGRFKREVFDLEKDIEFFYTSEREVLMQMGNSKLWIVMEQLNEGALFSQGEYEKFLNLILDYYRLASELTSQMKGDNTKLCLTKEYTDKSLHDVNKKICSFISIININNNQ